MAKFTMNPGWEKALAEEVTQSPTWAKIQEEAQATSQAIVAGVNESMRGGEVDAIFAVLVDQLGSAGFKPNEPNLRTIASEIAAGTFR